MSKLTAAALAFAAAPLLMSEAEASVILPGGETTIEVRYSFGSLPITATPTGTAAVDSSGTFPVFAFPITGGTANGSSLIEHDESGLELSDGTTSASVGNFVMDTMLGEIRGDVAGGPQDLSLFDLGQTTGNGVQLFLSDELETALEDIFGGNLPGGMFGFAKTSPTVEPGVVSLPAALPMLAGGLALVGAVGAFRRRS